MRKYAVVALGAVFAALGAIACGGNDKPPLTPDAEHPAMEAPDAGEAHEAEPAGESPEP